MHALYCRRSFYIINLSPFHLVAILLENDPLPCSLIESVPCWENSSQFWYIFYCLSQTTSHQSVINSITPKGSFCLVRDPLKGQLQRLMNPVAPEIIQNSVHSISLDPWCRCSHPHLFKAEAKLLWKHCPDLSLLLTVELHHGQMQSPLEAFLTSVFL